MRLRWLLALLLSGAAGAAVPFFAVSRWVLGGIAERPLMERLNSEQARFEESRRLSQEIGAFLKVLRSGPQDRWQGQSDFAGRDRRRA